jgi:hypothetical protein
MGPSIKNPKNNPIPVPKIPFLELPNFLAVNNGKKKSPTKRRIEIIKVKLKNLKLIIILELKSRIIKPNQLVIGEGIIGVKHPIKPKIIKIKPVNSIS